MIKLRGIFLVTVFLSYRNTDLLHSYAVFFILKIIYIYCIFQTYHRSWLKEKMKFTMLPSMFDNNEEKGQQKDTDAPIGSSGLINGSIHMLTNTGNSCFNFSANFGRIENVLFSIYNAIQTTEICEIGNVCQSTKTFPSDSDRSHKLKVDLEKCSKQLKSLLEDLDTEEIHLILMMVDPLFQNPKYQLPMYIHIFPPLSIALGPVKSRSVFLKGLQRLLDAMTISPDICSLVQQSFMSNILQAFGQDYFLDYVMGLLLDILSSSYQGQFSPSSNTKGLFTKTSTSTAPPSIIDASLPSESFMSFEVSPPYVAEKDSISISSFNLDVMFSDNPVSSTSSGMQGDKKCFLTDSQESTGADSTSLNSADLELESTPPPQLVRSSASITSRMKARTHTVISSQEILSNSGTEEMIEVSTTDQPLPSSFSSYDSEHPHHAPFLLRDPSNPANDVENDDDDYGKTSENIPFTILMASSSVEENRGLPRSNSNTKDPVFLEDVPTVSESPTKSPSLSRNIGDSQHHHQLQTSPEDLHYIVVDSLKWFIPWLGPNLTTEHITRPLLRNISKVLVEVPAVTEDVTEFSSTQQAENAVDQFLMKVSPHIECLLEIVSVYGDSVVTSLYLPRVTKIVSKDV